MNAGHSRPPLITVNPYAYAAWERCDGINHWLCVPEVKAAYLYGSCTCTSADFRRREITTALGAIDQAEEV